MRLQPVDSLLLTRTSLIEYCLFAARLVYGVTAILPGILILAYWNTENPPPPESYLMVQVFFGVVCVLMFQALGVCLESFFTHRSGFKMILIVCVWSSAFCVLLFMHKTMDLFDAITQEQLMVWFVASLAMFCADRVLFRLFYKRLMVRGFFLQSSLAILLLSPVMRVIAAAIKLHSRGPALFWQKRHGDNKRLITVCKFRSMHTPQTDATAEQHRVKGKTRLPRIGRLIRKTRLDELPQLFNVFAGGLSMVGPRPHATATKAAGIVFEQAVMECTSRHRVKPGITGPAQINGFRGETGTVEKIEKRVEFDLQYIENRSVWFDLYIFLRTAPAVLFSREAY
jgi:lipopolysaccharide/colanic/teichoic acid biosynthesis glycosyltransferase